MTCFRPVWFCAIGILLCFGASGCLPSGESRLDEQKEPHFMTGRNLVSQMDYPGAIDSFERALEVNPRSASAHFELGWLYEEKAGDPAAAIFHYDRYLKLRPTAANADMVKSLINTCKLEVARSVSALPAAPQDAQHELAGLAQQNQELKAQVAQWQ